MATFEPLPTEIRVKILDYVVEIDPPQQFLIDPQRSFGELTDSEAEAIIMEMQKEWIFEFDGLDGIELRRLESLAPPAALPEPAMQTGPHAPTLALVRRAQLAYRYHLQSFEYFDELYEGGMDYLNHHYPRRDGKFVPLRRSSGTMAHILGHVSRGFRRDMRLITKNWATRREGARQMKYEMDEVRTAMIAAWIVTMNRLCALYEDMEVNFDPKVIDAFFECEQKLEVVFKIMYAWSVAKIWKEREVDELEYFEKIETKNAAKAAKKHRALGD